MVYRRYGVEAYIRIRSWRSGMMEMERYSNLA